MKTNKILYQWDAGQKLTDCRGVFVDFVISGEVYRCDVVNGECIVPDELLQHPGNQTAYECMADNTLQEFVFSVVPRPLPPDYVYTPTEKLTFEGLVQKVEDTVADIIRRADTGEFDGYTPVKGKDYFTESEKNEMMQRVSDGAIGEFREVVDSATAGFNKNSSAKTNDYNANAEKKVGVYDSNAAEKLKAYNDNHTEKMTAYDTNATDKLSTYNSNAEQKLESYNQNHTEKVAEYNQNAETKTAEFDANAAALQTEVDRLRGECDTLAAENRKQENRISALLKLNKGQTYDILPEEGETVSRTAPSGAKYVSVDKVGGKSIVWNQLCNPDTFRPVDCKVSESSGIVTVTDCGNTNRYKAGFIAVIKGHKYYQTVKIKSDGTNPVGFQNYLFLDINGKTNSAEFTRLSEIGTCTESGNALVQLYSPHYTDYQIVKNSFMLFDLTLMFGAGNEPTAEQFEAMFPAESYPYNPGEIISSRTETITAGAETITTGFPELHSAGTAHDAIDMDGGTIQRNIGAVDLGTLDWTYYGDDNFMYAYVPRKKQGFSNLLCQRYRLRLVTTDVQSSDKVCWGNTKNSILYIKDLDYTEPQAFTEAMKGVTLYFELETPTTEPLTIPEALQEWLPVEAGGTVTFRNSDDTKQLPVPNEVSWVRKLNEVE